MTPFFVADIGNSRIKFGRTDDTAVAQVAVVKPHEPATWDDALRAIAPTTHALWLVASVQPRVQDEFIGWLRSHSFAVQLVADYRDVPIRVDVEAPDQVGIDRLLNALAARSRAPSKRAVAVISAGTAITVDLVDAGGTYCGGAILPGFHLMANALSDYTARLPLVDDFRGPIALPGRDTQSAIRAGIGSAIEGAIDRIISHYRRLQSDLMVVMTGGDSERIGPLEYGPDLVEPYLALDGLRLCRVLKR